MKASGSYASLVRGVSQQTPQERGPGQCTEQVNMIPDPVQGLTRRHGSRFQAEIDLGYSSTLLATLQADTDNWRTIEYSNSGNIYVVMIRTAARPVGSTLPPVLVYNRTTKTWLTYVRPASDSDLDLFESGGASAYTTVGKYLFAAGHTLIPASTSVDLWGAAGNQSQAAIWVRGGAYSRTYTVTATKTDNTVQTFSFTTPASSYQGVLDTSAVPLYAADPAGGTATDTEAAYPNPNAQSVSGVSLYGFKLTWAAWAPGTPTVKKGGTVMTGTAAASVVNTTTYYWDGQSLWFHSSNVGATDITVTYTHTKTVTNPAYTKLMNDVVNAYNQAVTKWIGTAAAAIAPENIAENLRAAAATAGLTCSRIQSHVFFTNVKALTVNDGGDGSLLRGVANEVTSVDKMTDMHLVGKIVKVRARNSQESFYLKAMAKDSQVTSGYTEVIWVEGCGTQHTINKALVYGTVSGNNFYMASSATKLNSIFAGTHPDYLQSTVGDALSSELPFFIGRKITYLGLFQDRLLVGAGAVIRASRTSDYLNFFRSSVLTMPADDSVEMLSTGSEQDELRHGVMYDRDLVIFGRDKQYAISGRAVLTPTNANMAVMSSHPNAADLPPIAVGGIMFYAKLGEVASSLHQVQPGRVAESPESFLVSSQIDDYMIGKAVELSLNAKPSCLFVRTTGARNSLFVFHYLDAPDGRKQDAWHRWDFDLSLGPIIGMSPSPDGLLVYSLRVGHNGHVYAVTDLCSLASNTSTLPYLDSIRPWATVAANTGSVRTTTSGPLRVAFDTTSEWQYLGDDLADAATLQSTYPLATGLWCGTDMVSSFVPTNPFMKDRQDKPITTGRLTVTKLLAAIKESSGFQTTVATKLAGTVDTISYNGRRLGDPNNRIGREVVTDLQQSIPVGCEARDYTLTIQARKWLPLTLSTLEWVGQFFNRTQRF
jgi:hypothetical protein